MAVTCRNILELHDAFIDGDLSPSLTAEVHAHLLQCPECQQQVEMLRAVGDVISTDPAAPKLTADFASRVVAAIPQSTAAYAPRRLSWRTWATVGLPTAAALFLAIAFWPKEDVNRPTMVLGVSAVKSAMDPTINAVSDARKTAASLKGLLDISMDQARQGVQEGLEKAGQHRPKAANDVSLTRVLLQPFDELLNPPEPPADQPEAKDTVRF